MARSDRGGRRGRKNAQDAGRHTWDSDTVFLLRSRRSGHLHYHAADILVATSHFEPFGLMVIEALSCGLPLAGFPCEGGATDLLSEAEALTTDHRDTADLSLKISEYFKLDPAVRRRDAGNRRKLVEANYSWAKSTASNLKIYKEAL